MSNLKKIFAEKLLQVEAIKLQPEQPFTWASGWKSPFYCDNRKTLAFPALRSFVKLELSRIVAEKYPEAEAVAGVATGAIAQGALVADALGLPFAYVRSKAKDHGMANLIEGDLKPGMKVVVIEDLISTGGSSLKAVEALRQHGCEVIGMVASYTYGFPVAEEAFHTAQVELTTLTLVVTPTAAPACLAHAATLVTGVVRSANMPSAPFFVLCPVASAVPEAAESVTPFVPE